MIRPRIASATESCNSANAPVLQIFEAGPERRHGERRLAEAAREHQRRHGGDEAEEPP